MAADSGEEAMLNIAKLGHKRVPSREGGVEIVVEELSAGMVRRGCSVTCYNRRGHHVSGKEFDNAEGIREYRGIHIKSVFTIEKKGLAAMTSSGFGALAAAFGKYDIVHFHAEGPCVMIWIPKLFGKRCIATVHGLDWKRAKWKNGLGAKYIKLGEWFLTHFADEIIVLSESAQAYFKEMYGRDTICIPNGVNQVQRVEACMISDLKIRPQEYILFLGRIVPEKGLDYLLDAFRKVKTDKKLVIAGGASDSKDYLEQVKRIADDDERVLFVGFVQGRLLEELYSNAYIYVLPSDLEGMSLSLLEAMSYGNCCLTSDISECTSVIGNHGLTFHRGDCEDLRNKLQLLCDNSSLVERYKKTAAAYICGKYSWEETIRRTINVYRGKESCTE